MMNFFQSIFSHVSTLVAAAVVTATSVLPGSMKPAEAPQMTPEPTALPIVQVVQETPQPSPTSTLQLVTLPNLAKKSDSDEIPAETPVPSPTTFYAPSSEASKPTTYEIIPISLMNIGAMNPETQVVARRAYNEFLGTPNLHRLNDATQIEILMGIYSRLLRAEITATQQNIARQQQENARTPMPVAPTPIPVYVNPAIEAKLNELRQSLSAIENQPIAMNVMQGKKQAAYREWVNNNQEVYSAIPGTRYVNELNGIIRAYGL